MNLLINTKFGTFVELVIRFDYSIGETEFVAKLKCAN